MLKEVMEKALNKHLNAELFSWYLYLSMAGYYEKRNFIGFSKWLKVQAQEEMGHAMKFFEYIHQAGGSVALQPIEGPQVDWETHLALFTQVLEHEIKVTNSIDDLIEMARNEKDNATFIFLQWFVTEQVEEVSTATLILEKLKLVGDNPNGLFLLDRELGMRQ